MTGGIGCQFDSPFKEVPFIIDLQAAATLMC